MPRKGGGLGGLSGGRGYTSLVRDHLADLHELQNLLSTRMQASHGGRGRKGGGLGGASHLLAGLSSLPRGHLADLHALQRCKASLAPHWNASIAGSCGNGC